MKYTNIGGKNMKCIKCGAENKNDFHWEEEWVHCHKHQFNKDGTTSKKYKDEEVTESQTDLTFLVVCECGAEYIPYMGGKFNFNNIYVIFKDEYENYICVDKENYKNVDNSWKIIWKNS